jgi:dTDP-4-dehydrorhamnose 3,5-epimerase
MKILNVNELRLAGIKIIRYGRFADKRGFFAEHFRESDFRSDTQLEFMREIEFMQCNESYSKPGTIRGLHFQWNPFMGKLVRTLRGRMVDLVLDIRKGSPTFGKIIGYDMPANPDADFGEWIWVPPGFAHGNFFTEESHIEYFCSGEYNPGCEAGIAPLSADIDWSYFNSGLKKEFDEIVSANPLMSEKDRKALTLSSWTDSPDSDRFLWNS